MPWSVYKFEDKWCVHKDNPDGSRGERVACHDTRQGAFTQLRALYTAEGKNKDTDNDDNMDGD